MPHSTMNLDYIFASSLGMKSIYILRNQRKAIALLFKLGNQDVSLVWLAVGARNKSR
jgi:hypothetical protein